MTQSLLTSRAGQPALAQTEVPAIFPSSAPALTSTVVQSQIMQVTVPVRGIAFTTVEIRDAKLRREYATEYQSDSQLEEAEANPGWSWSPVSKRDILALWSANIDDDLSEGCAPDNRFLRRRVEDIHRLRLNGLQDPTISDAVADVLNSIDSDLIRSHINFPRDTIQMAAADLVAWTYGEFNPHPPTEEDRVVGFSEFEWTRDYLAAICKFAAPKTASGVLDINRYSGFHGDKDPLWTDICITFLAAFTECSDLLYGSFDDVTFFREGLMQRP